MKILTCLFGAILVMSFQLAAQHKLVVTVKNIQVAEGSVRVALFDNEKDFLKEAYVSKSAPATSGSVTVTFEGLAKGSYGISVFHDANDNGELDKKFMGIPKEGFAFGNNAMGSFGPPSFDKAGVKVDEDVTHEISLKFF